MTLDPSSDPERDFHWRGRDVTRLEAVADGVFAIALGLVMLSGVVPKRVSELRMVFEQILPLTVSFAIIAMLWHAHYLFFRRYGLRDGLSALLSAVYLFLVLLFAYPLKLLFGLISQAMFGFGSPLTVREILDDSFPILPVYSAGFGAIYFVLGMLYRRAWSLREELALDELERSVTRQYIQSSWIMVGFALASIVLAYTLPPRWTSFAGWVFFGIGPVMAIHATRGAKARERMRAVSSSAVDRPEPETV
jgi:uncharacterized membrane protein